MNPPPGPTPHRIAVVRYATPDFEVIESGDHVLCAVSGRPVSLDLLTYWSVALQEPYSTAAYMTRRWIETHDRS